MALVYLPTWLGDFVQIFFGKYSSTMEHMGLEKLETGEDMGRLGISNSETMIWRKWG